MFFKKDNIEQASNHFNKISDIVNDIRNDFKNAQDQKDLNKSSTLSLELLYISSEFIVNAEKMIEVQRYLLDLLLHLCEYTENEDQKKEVTTMTQELSDKIKLQQRALYNTLNQHALKI